MNLYYRLWEATSIRGWSVFGVLVVLSIIAVMCGGVCAIAWSIGPWAMSVSGPVSALVAWRIWKAAL